MDCETTDEYKIEEWIFTHIDHLRHRASGVSAECRRQKEKHHWLYHSLIDEQFREKIRSLICEEVTKSLPVSVLDAMLVIEVIDPFFFYS